MDRDTLRSVEIKISVAFLLGIILGTISTLAVLSLTTDLNKTLTVFGGIMLLTSFVALVFTAITIQSVPRAIWIALTISVVVFSLGASKILSTLQLFHGTELNSTASPTSSTVNELYKAVCIPPEKGVALLQGTPDGRNVTIDVIPCGADEIQLIGDKVEDDGQHWVSVKYQRSEGWVKEEQLGK